MATVTIFQLDFEGWTDPDGEDLRDFSVYNLYEGKIFHVHYGVKTSAEFILPPGESKIMCAVKDEIGAITELYVDTVTVSEIYFELLFGSLIVFASMRGFEVSFASWDVADMILDVVVVVSRTEHTSKGVIIDTVDEEDAAEVDKLLDKVGAVSFKGIGD
ncbi:UNVERIFIED_CONTAM: hypothetical protein NCL1_45834 [Trichonephila clavipes]